MVVFVGCLIAFVGDLILVVICCYDCFACLCVVVGIVFVCIFNSVVCVWLLYDYVCVYLLLFL